MPPMEDDKPTSRSEGFLDHRRQWREMLYVYPVLARRSGGLSIGVNLNWDKRCTFSCVYCQIDRGVARPAREVDLAVLRAELDAVLSEAVSGQIWSQARFAGAPAELRRINDIAFSGDGEPTCVANFAAAVAVAAEAKAAVGLNDVKIVVITNGSQLTSPRFQAALPILDANNGEIWAKLDAGSEQYFQTVNRPEAGIHLTDILAGIVAVARGRAMVIQSLFCALHGCGPDDEETAAYCDRLREIVAGGGKIKLVQIHTVARPPAEPFVSALSAEQLEAIAAKARQAVSGAAVETYCGAFFTPPADGGDATSRT